MKIYSIAVVTMFVLFSTVCAGLAQEEKATKEDCVNLTKEAAEMIRTEGLEATLEKINAKNGPFVFKDTYVFCFFEDTVKMVGHPFTPERWRDVSRKDYMDANGKLIFQEFIKTVEENGEGWVDYMHTNTVGEKPRKKISFVMKVPDTKVIVGAGVYE